ncbi:MAG: hypothetical protein LBR70_04540 [Lactobacillaceae bacterium]|jgi:tellurite resistance protein|nr:hypothetical protein [Lactobacillaceae bacterium]
MDKRTEIDKEKPFCNMRANLLIDGKYQDEEIAVNNVWHKGVSIFIDLYLHDLEKPLIIDSLYVRELEDLSKGLEYSSVKEFVDTFLNYKYDKKSNFQGTKSDENVQYLESLYDDIAILKFIGKIDGELSEIKYKSMEDYIARVKPETKSLTDNYIRNYIINVNSSKEDFYRALETIENKKPKEAAKLFMEAAKVAASDGYISYPERKYLAEIMQTLRENEFSLKDCII